MSSRLTVVLLSLILGIQPVSSDLYLPALPAITQELGAHMGQAHLTLSALLLAFGISQLLWGPLSDRFGRRPMLLAGLIAYTLASMGCVMASAIETLIVWRMVQGAAMGAVVMCGRAIVRDLYTPDVGARVMSKALTGLGFIACLSAPLGAWVTEALGWHYALAMLAVFGACTGVAVGNYFQESVQHKNPKALELRVLASTWWRIVRHPTFVAFSCLSISTFGGLFVFLSTSSFVFIGILGLSRMEYGVLLASMSGVYILGTLLCRRLLPRFAVRGAVAIGGGLSLLGGLWMLCAAYLGWHSVAGLMAPYYVFVLAHGIHQPCGQSGSVGPFPHAAGAASALGGFSMMAAAFMMGMWLSAHVDGTLFPMVQAIAFCGLCTALTAWILVRRYGGPSV
jgi:DHA1 family bicyclomycin/chloramphenicol resistance-like MFS transporter